MAIRYLDEEPSSTPKTRIRFLDENATQSLQDGSGTVLEALPSQGSQNAQRGGIGQPVSKEEAQRISRRRMANRDPRLFIEREGFPEEALKVKGQGALPQALAAAIGSGFTAGPARLIQDLLLKSGLTTPEAVETLGVQAVAEENPGTALAAELAGGTVPAGKVFQGATAGGRLLKAGALGGLFGASKGVAEEGLEGLTERPGELAGEAAKTGVLSMILPGAIEAPGLAQRLFAGKINPEARNLTRLAEEMGVPLTPAQAGGSRRLGLAEKTLQNIPTSSGVIEEAREASQKGLQRKASSLLEEAGPGQTAEQIGEKIQEAISPRLKKFRERSTVLYQALEDSAAGSNIPLGNVSKVARDFVEREGKKEGFASSKLMGQLKTFLEKETPESTVQKFDAYGAPVTEVIPASKTPPEIDVRTFQDIRASVNDEIQTLLKNEKTDSARKLQIVKTAMDDALKGFADKSGGKVKEAFDVANEFYEKGANVFFDPKIKRIIDANPESVYGLIVKPNAVTDINTLKRALGEEGFKPVRRAFMEKILATEGEDIFSPAKFSTALNKFEPETLNAVFGKDVVQDVLDFQKVAQAIVRNERRVGNPSGTAQNIIAPSYVGGVFGLTLTNPALGVASVLGPPALAKLYTSKTGLKLLTEALKTPADSPKAAEILTRLSAIASEESEPKNPAIKRIQGELSTSPLRRLESELGE